MATSKDESFPTLRSSWSRYLADGWRSDMKIICDGVVHNVHTTIVCAQSTFFANALKEEHNFVEAQTNTVTLEDDDPATVDAAVKFMYLQTYSNTAYGKEPEQRVTFQISVYAFGDKYGISGLREFSMDRIKKLLDAGKFSPKLFVHAASTVDDNIPENDKIIRPALASIASKNIHALFGEPQFWHIAKAAGGLGGAVLENLAASGQIAGTGTGPQQFTCPDCGRDVTMALCGNGRGSTISRTTYCPSCGCRVTNKKWESRRKKDV